MKIQAKDWKKIFSNHIKDERLVSKIYIESSELNTKKNCPVFLNGQKTWTDISLKKIYRWQINIQKDIQCYLSLRKWKLKPHYMPIKIAKNKIFKTW